MHPCCKNSTLLRKHHKNTPIFTQIDAVSVPKRNDFSGLAPTGAPLGAIRVAYRGGGVGHGGVGGYVYMYKHTEVKFETGVSYTKRHKSTTSEKKLTRYDRIGVDWGVSMSITAEQEQYSYT